MAKKKSRRWIWIVAAVVVTLGLFAIFGKRKKETLVEFGTVTKGTITEVVSGTGPIESNQIYHITSDVSGEVVMINVEEGDTVKKGQLIINIRPDNYISMVDKARANMNAQQASALQAESQVLQAQAKLDKAKLEFDRNKGLFEQKVVAQSDFQTYQTNFDVAKQDLAVARQTLSASRYNLESAKANLKDAEENLRKTSIVSPIDGLIIKKSVEKGERVVGTSQMAGTEILQIARLDKMSAEITVNENDILKLKIGDTARIEVDAYPDHIFLGYVTEIGELNKTKATTDAITEYYVRAEFSHTAVGNYAALIGNYIFKNGMTANADIVTNTVAGVMRVPLSAVVFVQDTTLKQANTAGKPAGQEIVYVDSSGFATTKPVITGLSDFNYIEIKSGLKDGDKIITGPYNTITKGLKKGDAIKDIKSASSNGSGKPF